MRSTVTIPKDHLMTIRQLAAENNLSVNAVIRTMVSFILINQDKKAFTEHLEHEAALEAERRAERGRRAMASRWGGGPK